GHRLGIVRLHRAHESRARLRHLREHGLLVLRVSLHGVYEIRNQIGAPLQLNFDLRLIRLRALVELLDAVVPARRSQSGERDDEPTTRHVYAPCKLGVTTNDTTTAPARGFTSRPTSSGQGIAPARRRQTGTPRAARARRPRESAARRA